MKKGIVFALLFSILLLSSCGKAKLPALREVRKLENQVSLYPAGILRKTVEKQWGKPVYETDYFALWQVDDGFVYAGYEDGKMICYGPSYEKEVIVVHQDEQAVYVVDNASPDRFEEAFNSLCYFPGKTLFGEEIDVKAGDLLKITWNGFTMETYPGQYGSIYAYGYPGGELTEEQVEELEALYLERTSFAD